MTRLADRGLALDVPRGWEGRIFTPRLPPPAINRPVLHLADFALPLARGSYAAESAARMGPRGILISLVEFDPALANLGLYAPQGIPRIVATDLDPRTLQVPHPDQAGVQRFFSVNGRAFSLYAIAGLAPGLPARVRDADRVLSSIDIASEPVP